MLTEKEYLSTDRERYKVPRKDETVDMLLVLRDREAERGDQAEADKYARLARGILEVFEREEGAKFAESSFYRWGRGILEKLR